MRLLTVTHFYETHGGGIERVAGRLNRHLAALGHEMVWAASAGDPVPDPETASPVPLRCNNVVERLSGLPMPLPSPAALRRLKAAVRESDVVIVHDGLYATSVAALRAARKAGKPVLLVQHIAAIPFRRALLRGAMGLANRLITGPMLGAADQVVFISETTAAHFAGLRFRRPPLTIFNGVDTGLFRPAAPGEKEGARNELGLAEDASVALFVGRFVEKKGLAVLKALAALRPDVAFLLAGGGPIDPAGWGLANVQVLAGYSGERLAALYRAADLFVLPSVGEGYPLVVQEALASGLPVLCGAESAVADPAATPFLHGIAVDLTDPASIASAFAGALDAAFSAPGNPGAAEFARDHYSWEQVARRYDTAIRVLAPAPHI
ncbi:MAG TPA: glycosyltransferase family 4 protein [Allosphingosinicella sp.]